MHIPLGLLFLIICSLHHTHTNGITLFPDHAHGLSLPFVVHFIYKNFYEVQQAPVQQTHLCAHAKDDLYPLSFTIYSSVIWILLTKIPWNYFTAMT